MEAEPEPVEPPPEYDPSVPPQDVSGFILQASRASGGLFNISATWKNAGNIPGVSLFVVGQSFDGGKTFSEPTFIPGNTPRIDVQNVPHGEFGLFIQAMDSTGRVSTGIFQSVQLIGAGENVPPTPVAERPIDVPTPTPAEIVAPVANIQQQSDNLPSSGAAFALVTLAITGGFMGWKGTGRKRRRK